jgi:hypothetical protein
MAYGCAPTSPHHTEFGPGPNTGSRGS